MEHYISRWFGDRPLRRPPSAPSLRPSCLEETVAQATTPSRQPRQPRHVRMPRLASAIPRRANDVKKAALASLPPAARVPRRRRSHRDRGGQTTRTRACVKKRPPGSCRNSESRRRARARGSRLPHARASACCLLGCGQWSTRTTTTVPYQEGFKTSALAPLGLRLHATGPRVSAGSVPIFPSHKQRPAVK